MKIGGDHPFFIYEKTRSIICFRFLPDLVFIFTQVHMAIAVDLRTIHPRTTSKTDTVITFILNEYN